MKLSLGLALQQANDEHSPLDILKTCKEIGFGGYDFSITCDMVDENRAKTADHWRRLFEQAELPVTQTHAPFRNSDPLFDQITGTLDFCRKAGFPNTVIHPLGYDGNSRDEFFENNITYVRSLIPYVEETGIELLVENIGQYTDPYFFWSGKDLRDFLDEVNHPLVNACWDIGHANHFYYFHVGGSPYDAIVTLGDKLKAVHAHDNVGYFTYREQGIIDMHAAPYASHANSVNWDAVMQGLKDIRYTGTFNFETSAVSPSDRRPRFVYKGEIVRKLQSPSFAVWKAATATLFEIGKFMLETYDMFDE